jgi:hypothetical protein
MNENARAKIVEISDDIIKYENTEIVISQLSDFFHFDQESKEYFI